MNIKNKFSSLTINTKGILKDFRKAEIENRREAAKHVTKKMRQNISDPEPSLPGEYPGRLSGNLRKGIGHKNDPQMPYATIIGSKDPKSHLLEWGHGDGKSFNKRPFFNRTLDEEEPVVVDMMSKRWDK